MAEVRTPPDVQALFDSVPAPKRLVLLGKGESLDCYAPGMFAPAPVMAINEAMVSKPCDYGIYVDKRHGRLEIPEEVVLIRPRCRATQHGGRGYTFHRKGVDPRTLVKATAGMAIYIAGLWGVQEIVFVGFDGYDRNDGKINADCVTLLDGRENADYANVNECIDAALAHTGIGLTWFHRRFGEVYETART